MAQSIDFKIGFLEKIGTPLLSAIIAEQSSASSGDDQQTASSEAKTMAGLLGKSVSLSSELAGMLDLGKAGTDAESVRVALAAVVARIVADYNAVSGKMPDEAATKRLLSAMETALMFSDHFAPDADHIARLAGIDPEEGNATDEAQIGVQYMNIMVPVVSVVADYTFGRNEKKLVLEIAERLTAVSGDMAKKVSVGDDDVVRLKRLEIRIMKAAVRLFTDCYRQETARIKSMSDEERSRLSEQSGTQLPMDDLWESFATRFAMLGVLAGLPDDIAMADSDGAPAPASVAEAVEVPVPQQEAGPAEAVAPSEPVVEVEEPKVSEAEPPQEQSGGDDNPMSFFAKKPQSSNAGDENSGGTMV